MTLPCFSKVDHTSTEIEPKNTGYHNTILIMSAEEPMGIIAGWKAITEKAIVILLDQLKKGFDKGAKPFDNKDYVCAILSSLFVGFRLSIHCFLCPSLFFFHETNLNPPNLFSNSTIQMEVYTICYNLCTQRAPRK